MNYQEINSKTVDNWVENGWEWGRPISHDEFARAQKGDFKLYLTPTRLMPKEWIGDVRGKSVLGLASGGGQQMPILSALGAECTVLDYSKKQCEAEQTVALREGYKINVLQADMTKPLPFTDNSFDIIIHPVSNCYVEEVLPIFKECFRILKPEGVLVCGLDNGINYIFDDDETTLKNKLPFNPLKNPALMDELMATNSGVQFSHTFEEQVGGQLKAGFVLTHLYEDTNGLGKLHEYNIPTMLATRAVKPK